MQSKTIPRINEPQPSHPVYLNEGGLSNRKTGLIILTVIGCIAILFPKVFYPMMFGGSPQPKSNAYEQRGGTGGGGCCDVVLDRDKFYNSTMTEMGPQPFRKKMNLYTGEISVRQERPAHLHPDSVYQAMRERGRAIPTTQTVPILERKGSPSNPPPRIVEGRPGPIPGMRPPMGAGALHQPQAKGSSMGFIMPLYTIGILVFFGYTIMKIVFKKPLPNAPYGAAPTDPNFRKEVFGLEGRHVEELNGSKLGWKEHQTRYTQCDSRNELYNASLSAVTAASNITASLKQHQQQFRQQQKHDAQQQHQQQKEQQSGSHNLMTTPSGQLNQKESDQLLEIEKLRKKLEDTERAMAKLIAEMNSDRYEAKKPNENSTLSTGTSNGFTKAENEEHVSGKGKDEKSGKIVENDKGTEATTTSNTEQEGEAHQNQQQIRQRKCREGSADRSVAVLGMEMTASCEGGQKWSRRPPTPDFPFHSEHSKSHDIDVPLEPQEIYLEGALAPKSQILVADAQTKTEKTYDEELNGSSEEPAVVLSSKMTLSLINLDPDADGSDDLNKSKDMESPLADDIEIVAHSDARDSN